MKKLFLILAASVTLLAYQTSAQTISVTGTSGTISGALGSTFDSTISLSITGSNTIGDVESLNMLLRTAAGGGGLSGAGLFSVQFLSGISPFTLPNNPTTSSFNTVGDANNPGAVSDPIVDLGASAPANPPTVASTGTTSFNVEVLRLTALSTLSPGTYNFYVTDGGIADAQGSWIDNSANLTFDVNDEPLFTITVPVAVPEPSTWVAAIGVVGVIGYTMLRRRQTA